MADGDWKFVSLHALAAELLLLMDLALEKPLELEVRLPSPRGIASNDIVGSCDVSCVGVTFDDVLGLNLSRNDLLPVWFIWEVFGGSPNLELNPEVETLGPGRPEVIFLDGDMLLLMLFAATGMDLQGDGGTDGILGVPPLSCIP